MLPVFLIPAAEALITAIATEAIKKWLRDD
jgi:hypothetical protein